MPRAVPILVSSLLAAALTGCRSEGSGTQAEGPASAALGEPSPSTAAGPESEASDGPSASAAAASSRHGEYVMYATLDGDSVRAFVVYPERSGAAPSVIVIHEIFGLTDWIRSVADRYAAEGFISIAPDLLWGRGPGGRGTDAYPGQDEAIAAIRELPADVVNARLDGARDYLRSLSASNGEVGTVGFCWGGHQSFQYAAVEPDLGAAVVFYGSGPEPLSAIGRSGAPVLGLYGGDDNRVNASIPDVERVMSDAERLYEKEVYPGAGHGFLREDSEGANAEAASRAWPRSVEFLKRYLGDAGGGDAERGA